MTTGFKAWTDSGVFQIDGESINFQLISRQTGQTANSSLNTVTNDVGTQFGANYNHVQFSFTANSPMVAFRAPDGVRISPWSFSRSGNTYTATFITDASCVVTMWVFDQAAAVSDNFGFKIWNSSGALVCSAIQPFAKIIDIKQGQYLAGTGFYSGGGQMPGNNVQTQTYGNNVAFAACYPCHYMESTGDNSTGGGSTNMSGLKINGTTISWEFFCYAGTRSGNYVGFKEATAYSFLVLDMTGIP